MLTDAQVQTLREMRSYGEYGFRQATCRRLVATGLAELCNPNDKRVRPWFRITDAGRRALAEHVSPPPPTVNSGDGTR